MFHKQKLIIMSKFKYSRFNIIDLLPSSWQIDILQLAETHQKKVVITAGSVTSREANTSDQVETLVVDGNKIKEKLLWLFNLYQGLFYEYAKTCTDEELFIAQNPLYAIDLNIQRGNKMRYECHVDSNPLQGLLYVTSHPEGSGGELVVANKSEALGIEEINKDCVRIFPNAGDLIFFDAREHPHYVTSLVGEDDVRISVAMNFYTPSSTESERPADLNKHLFEQK